MSAALSLRIPGADTVEFVPSGLVVVGFSGRDQAAVERHVAELEAAGVPRPAETPAFYVLKPSLLTQQERVVVESDRSSGEVEPVLFCTPDGRFVGIGSDHTARDVERESIELSKSVCPKIVGRDVIPVEKAVEHWDELVLECWTGAERQPYQHGVASELLPIPELLGVLTQRIPVSLDGLVVFLGTLSLLRSGFVFSDRYELAMRLPRQRLSLSCAYDVTVRANGGAAHENR